MATFGFKGNLVGAVSKIAKHGSAGAKLDMDKDRDLSDGKPWYSHSDLIEISIAEEDIASDGSFVPDGVDGKVTVTSIKVNGVELLDAPTFVRVGDGSEDYDSDLFFWVEGVDLAFLAPQSGITFDDLLKNSSSGEVEYDKDLKLDDRIVDLDLDEDGSITDGLTGGLTETGDGVFNIGATTSGISESGSASNDTIDGSDKGDSLRGGGGDDFVSGDGGDDFLFGDFDESGPVGRDATPLVTDINNLESQSYTTYYASEGDHVIYRDVAQLEDGTSVSARLVLLEKSDPWMDVSMSGGPGYEIEVWGYGTGDQASFRLEFFDPATGLPIALNGVASFNDLDSNGGSDVEAVILESSNFDSFSTSADTNLLVTQGNGQVRAEGTQANDPTDEVAWFSAAFSNRTSLEFSLEARSTPSGFTFSGDLISNAVTTMIEQGDDTLSGGLGDDVIHGQGGSDDLDGGEGADILFGGDGNDKVDGGTGNDRLSGDEGADELLGGTGNDTIDGGTGSDTLVGGDGDDLISGGEGSDFLKSGLGQDTLEGGEGDDTLMNAAGDDSLVGGVGDDLIVATQGVDTLEGEAGNDTLMGGTDGDSVDGGADNDLLLGDLAGVIFNETGTDGLGLSSGITDFPTSALTYEITFASVQDPNSDVILASYASSAGSSNELLLSIEGGNLRVNLDDGSVANTGISGTSLLDGSIKTLSVSWENTTGALEVYVDGVSSYSGTLATGQTLDQGGTFVLGQEQDAVGGGFNSNQIFQGKVFGARLYNDVRTPTEVLESVHAPVANTSDANLVANWVADPDGPGMTDLTGSHPMTLSGDVQQGWSSGDDTLLGGTGADTIYGGGGDDSIVGGDGDDLLRTGLGNDTAFGGAGNDTIMNSDGDDSLDGGTGDDSIVATGGEDTLRGGEGADTMEGGDDADTFIIEDGFGNDVITGGEGTTNPSDTDFDVIDLTALSGSVTVTFTGEEAGTITDGVDTISFSEIEHVIATDQDDVIDASGQTGTTGIDVDAAGGNDTVTGGDGDDTIVGGTGDDSITGGSGDDSFTYTVGDGADTITDFNTGNSGALGDGDSTNNDFIDLSSYYTNLVELRADFDDDGVLNQSSGDYTDNTNLAGGDSLTFSGADRSSFKVDNTGVVCFAAGTMILTDRGEVPVERLRASDYVQTYDNGLQPIAMIASKRLDTRTLAANPNLKPIEIKSGALGVFRRLLVSPQHAMLVKTGNAERFLRARQLSRLPNGLVRVMHGCKQVTYFHLIFERHQIIFANGRPSESFFPGARAIASLSTTARQEFYDLFPDFNVAERLPIASKMLVPARDPLPSCHMPKDPYRLAHPVVPACAH